MSASRLARFGEVLQVVVCVVVLAIALSAYWRRDRTTAVDAAAKLAVGTQIGSLPGVSYARRPLTLVLFERSTCQYCTQSMPLYQSLSRMIDRERIQFVVASSEGKETSEAYLRSYDVVADRVVQLEPASSYPIHGTPTLVIVDNRGKVRHSWVGLLDDRREQEVKNAILPR
jgi:thioredoxin-related protein